MTQQAESSARNIVSPRPSLLIVEDDRRLAEYLFRMIVPLGYSIDVAETHERALEKIASHPPDHALLDWRIPGGTGPSLIRPLKSANPSVRIVLCTAYPSIAGTVEAMRLGANDVLVKPVTPEQILGAFGPTGATPEVANTSEESQSEAKMLTLSRARWEYIHMVLANCGGNVAAAARHLGIHRQSLQRMLKKSPPPG